MDPEDIQALGAVLGDVVEIAGKRKTAGRVTGTLGPGREMENIQIDGLIRSNAQVEVGDIVRVRKVPRQTATTVVLYLLEAHCPVPREAQLEHFGKVLQGYPVLAGDQINIPLFGGRDRFFRVEGTSPSDPVIINPQTNFVLQKPDYLVNGAAQGLF